MVRLGFAATSASEGAGKWTPDLNEWFRDRIVYILPDNDQQGAKHADQVARSLVGVAREIRIVPLPGLSDREDVYDWIGRGGTAAQLEDIAAGVSPTSAAGQETADKPLKFKLVPFDDLAPSKITDYLVKGLFPRKGMAEVWGPPKCGQSFWVMTVMLHVAMGRDYRGHRVHQHEVVYLALEGQAGFDDRAEAFSQHNLEPGKKVPAFKLCGATLDLVKEHLQLIAEIRAQSSSPGCIVIDTMNRSLVGSESKDEDMAAYIRAADVLPQAFGCLIVIIHHCGVDETRPRGHTSQTGAADVQISVKKETGTSVVTATVELAKDMGEGTTIASRLKVVELGPDQDEDQITTCVVLPVEEAAAATQGKGSSKAKKLAPQTVTALKAIKEAITETGIVPPESNHIPPNTKGVTKDQWRDYAHRREICPISTREGKTSEEAEWLLKEAQRKAFSRACAELTAAGQVGCWNDFYWLTKE